MKKILFVHIKDPSTDFLEVVYKDRPHSTIVRANVGVQAMNNLIECHDQVVMMGHGSSSGLFGPSGEYIIDHRNVNALAAKDNNVFIWCYASTFVHKYMLKGFSTSMFISEHAEAMWALPANAYDAADEHSIVESNYLFVSLVRKHLEQDVTDMSKCIIESYIDENLVADNKNVLNYNRNGLQTFI